jgi:multidrug transporter EmrE-like cation transporter
VIYWIALAGAVAANVVANLALKIGATSGVTPTTRDHLFSGWQSPWLWAGVGAAGLLLVCYVGAIRGIALSVAYPTVTGFSMVGVTIVSSWALGEPLGLRSVAGTGLVIVGVAVLTLPLPGQA